MPAQTNSIAHSIIPNLRVSCHRNRFHNSLPVLSMSLARSLARSLALARVTKKHHIAFATAATAVLVVMHVELARNTRSSSFPILIIAQSTNKNNIILIYRLNFSASKSCSPGPGICRVPHYIERSCPGFSSQIDNQRWRCSGCSKSNYAQQQQQDHPVMMSSTNPVPPRFG